MINYMVRIKNPMFWLGIAAAMLTPVLAYAGITLEAVGTWDVLGSAVLAALQNPYVALTMAVSVYNAVVDPTTRGFGDSRRALGYTRPTEG